MALNNHAPKIAAALIIRNGCLSFDLAFAATLWAFFVLHVTSPFGRWLLSRRLYFFDPLHSSAMLLRFFTSLKKSRKIFSDINFAS